MATVAELKARLLKYGKPNGSAGSNQIPATVPVPERTERPVPVPVVEQIAVSAEGPTDSSTVGHSTESNGRQESPAVDGPAVSMEVVTELQSTDVVIVERPVEREVGSPVEGQELVGSGTNLDTSNPVHQGFLQRLAELEVALLERDPLMKTHLGAIHKAMIQYEEIANLLRPDEIAKIMAAQQAHTGMILKAEILGKSKAATNKKAAQLGLNDV